MKIFTCSHDAMAECLVDCRQQSRRNAATRSIDWWECWNERTAAHAENLPKYCRVALTLSWMRFH